MQIARANKAKAIEANRIYQATRLYSTPLVYGESDERRETGDYGLTHMVMTVTNRRCFDGIIHYSLPIEAARVLQVRKMFGSAVEAAEEQVVRHLHALHFSRVPLVLSLQAAAEGGGGTSCSWTRYLHELVTNKSRKILLMGGREKGLEEHHMDFTNRVDMMVIDDKGTKISWQACAPMIKRRFDHAAYYCQGQVLSASTSSEIYDVLSQKAVELERSWPIPDLINFAMIEHDGKMLVIGGEYEDADGHNVRSDRVFCHDKQAGTWIELSRLITARRQAAAASYEGKVWVAGGFDENLQPLSSIEVLDPLVGSWQAAGKLTAARNGITSLFTIDGDLFAAGCAAEPGMWVEKRDRQNCNWYLMNALEDGMRSGCAFAACSSTIYFFGSRHGYDFKKCWNSFDTLTGMWASEEGEQYEDEASRQMPRGFMDGQAVCITPSEQLSSLGTWSSYPDFEH